MVSLFYVGAKGVNFGDSINPIFFERILGLKVERAYPTNAEVMGIGSLLELLTLDQLLKSKKLAYFFKYDRNPIIIAGSGFKFDIEGKRALTKTYREVIPKILRGKKSHSVLERINNKSYKVDAYGDLGLLFNLLLEKPVIKRYSVGVIPHNTEVNNPIVENLLTMNNACLINLRQPPLQTLEQIAACETIISSSLHGLIAADSLNIPNKRIKLSEHRYNQNIDFKFEDYYSAIADFVPKYLDFTQSYSDEIFDELLPNKIIESYKIDNCRVKETSDKLLKVAMSIKDELL